MTPGTSSLRSPDLTRSHARSDNTHDFHADLDGLRAVLLELTPAQQLAVEALAGGGTQQKAAEAAGVTRETVTRWAGHLPAFRATLNLYRTTIVTEQIDTARRIRGKALGAIETALDEGRIDPPALLRVVTDATGSIGHDVVDR